MFSESRFEWLSRNVESEDISPGVGNVLARERSACGEAG